ncbi:MAG TPA: hypothetical protein VM163_03340 [bacterium]|nr:hypothetical protein [bacterium]
MITAHDAMVEATKRLPELLSRAESLYGTRDMRFTIAHDIRIESDGPRICFRNDDLSTVIVVLGQNVITHPPNVPCQLAHECIHLLNPTQGNTNFLEEGAAVHFQLEVILESHGRKEHELQRNHLNEAYHRAHELYCRLVSIDARAPHALRSPLRGWSALDSADIAKAVPCLPGDLAERLAAPCMP